MQAIILKAGFKCSRHTNNTHFNARQGIEPPLALLLATPFAFCYSAAAFVKTETDEWPPGRARPNTANQFLDLMHQLNMVFLQDMAAIWVTEVERRDHPIFSTIAVFQMREWKEYVELVQRTLAAHAVATESEATRGVEHFLPGLMDRLSGMEQKNQLEHEHSRMRNEDFCRQLQATQAETQATFGQMQVFFSRVAAEIGFGLQRAANGMSATAAPPVDQVMVDPHTTATAVNADDPSPNAVAALNRPKLKYQSITNLWDDWHERF
jgi:hypothetical protein